MTAQALTTTDDQADAQFVYALDLLDAQVTHDGFPEGERAKAMRDMLTNYWKAGITLEQWAERAAARLAPVESVD